MGARSDGRRYGLACGLLLATVGGLVLAACGSAGSPATAPSPTATETAASTTALVASAEATLAGRPSAEIMQILQGRIAAINRGDGEAAAAYYADDGEMWETDLGPEAITRGREAIAKRLRDLYEMGLRIQPAGEPITYDRYVAEPVRFLNGNGPGEGAGILVFEIKRREIVRQWVIGWVR